MENAEGKNSSDIEALKKAAEVAEEKLRSILTKLSNNSLDIEALNAADAALDNLEPILKKLIALEKQ